MWPALAIAVPIYASIATWVCFGWRERDIMVVAYVVPPFFIAAAARAMIAFGLYCNVLPPLGVAGELAAIGVALSYG
ncbi:MAG TPA: hypothetical protein VE010_16975, partial [Thermoanaerobaculia bacterium]|nr:hypothetical protein [Thermoanaerobaculia bacterium]